MNLRSLSIGTLVIGSLSIACGDSQESLLFAPPDLVGTGGAMDEGVGGSAGTSTGGTSTGGTGAGFSTGGGGGSGSPDASVPSGGSGGIDFSDAGSGASAGSFNSGGSGGGPEGGAATGGAPASGGAAGSGGTASGGTPNVPTDGFVRCGEALCDVSEGEVCCTSMTPSGTQTRCSESRMGCTRAFECDNHGDCGHGELCCLSYSGQSLSPSTSCQAECEIPVECGGASDCAAGELCCGVGITVPLGTLYTTIACRSTCTGSGSYILCGDGTPCPEGTSCLPSSHFPAGYPVCK